MQSIPLSPSLPFFIFVAFLNYGLIKTLQFTMVLALNTCVLHHYKTHTHTHTHYIYMCVCLCVYVCVCVCVRARARARVCVCIIAMCNLYY